MRFPCLPPAWRWPPCCWPPSSPLAATHRWCAPASLILCQAGLRSMTASVALGLIALALALVWLVVSAFRHNRGDGKRAGMIGAAGSAAPALCAAAHRLSGPAGPAAIHDATTDPEDPPALRRAGQATAPTPGFDAGAHDRLSRRAQHRQLHAARILSRPHQALMPIMVTGTRRQRCSGAASRPPSAWAGTSWITTRRKAASKPPPPASGSARSPTS